MGIKIGDEQMASGITRHSAMADGDGWIMTWLPGRALTRSQATTAMVLARTVAAGIGDHTDPRWPRIQAWTNKLGLSGADAVGKISYYGVDHPARPIQRAR